MGRRKVTLNTYFGRILNYFLKKRLSQLTKKKTHLDKATNSIRLNIVKPLIEHSGSTFELFKKTLFAYYTPSERVRNFYSDGFLTLGVSCGYLTLLTASETNPSLKYHLLYLFFKQLFLTKNFKKFTKFRKLLAALKLMSLSQQNTARYSSSRNAGSSQNLVLYQTLNDYFFSPSFYFNVNKGSR